MHGHYSANLQQPGRVGQRDHHCGAVRCCLHARQPNMQRQHRADLQLDGNVADHGHPVPVCL